MVIYYENALTFETCYTNRNLIQIRHLISLFCYIWLRLKKWTGVTSQWTSTLSTCSPEQSISLQLHKKFLVKNIKCMRFCLLL